MRTGSLCGLGQLTPSPVLSTMRYFLDEYIAHIEEKRCPAGACQPLVRAGCVNACPAQVDTPAYLALVAQGRYREGLEIHREANPFALICGRVCPAFCEHKCRRGQIDTPIAIRMVKRFMADQEYEQPWTPPIYKSPQRKRIAVVGAGPGGLTAALRLAQQGYRVSVFEALPQPGGMMTYGIPAYRLPREPLFSEVENIKRAGVEIYNNMALGRDFSLDDLQMNGEGSYAKRRQQRSWQRQRQASPCRPSTRSSWPWARTRAASCKSPARTKRASTTALSSCVKLRWVNRPA